MQIVLDEKDLAAMPEELRRRLLDYVAGRLPPPKAGAGEPLRALNQMQAVALLRELSFAKGGGDLRTLLERVVRAGDKPPASAALVKSLRLKGAAELGRRIAAVERVARKLPGADGRPLLQVGAEDGAVVMHPATRGSLTDVLDRLARSGEHEEALWE
jgi:hypothetical protein